MSAQSERGLYTKYRVQREDGRDNPGGDREHARYFVLDYVHDPFARAAVQAYIEACYDQHSSLARDLNRELRETELAHRLAQAGKEAIQRQEQYRAGLKLALNVLAPNDGRTLAGTEIIERATTALRHITRVLDLMPEGQSSAP